MKNILYMMLLGSLLLLSGCSNADDGKKQSLEQFLDDAKIEHVDKVTIKDGSTGASKTITEQKQMDEFLALIKDIQFTPQDNQEHRVGWRYAVTLFDDEETFHFTLSKIDGIYYDSKPAIHPIVDTYYKQLDIAEE